MKNSKVEQIEKAIAEAQKEQAAAAEGNTVSLPGGAFTAGMDSRKLTLNRGDYIRVGMLEHPITGKPL